MTKTIRWNINLVTEYVNNNSSSVLISTEFTRAKDKLSFRCECGNEYSTTFESFRLNNKKQCSDCGRKIMKKKQSLSYKEVLKYVKDNSDSILLSESYVNTKEKLLFKCKCGDTFEKSFEKFKSKSKTCKNCSYKAISESQTFNYEFVKEYIESKNCKLLDDKYTDSDTNLNVKCNCGLKFIVKFNYFKNHNQTNCKVCTGKISKGELIIKRLLDDKSIKYKEQFSFKDLKSDNGKHFLKFDFAIFDEFNKINFLLEFDGKQHYQAVDFFGGEASFNTLKKNDTYKNEYCKLNNIKLIRIPYFDIDNVENILNENLNLL